MKHLKWGTHKTYWMLVMAMSFLLLLAFYKFKMSSTIDMVNNYCESEARLVQSLDADERLNALKQTLGNPTSKSTEQRTKEILQQELLEVITTVGMHYNVNVLGITNPRIKKVEHFEITGFVVDLTGGFQDIVKTLSAIETNDLGMRLSSVEFKAWMNRDTKKKQLNAQIYVQHMKLID
jgi:hypothetical protein